MLVCASNISTPLTIFLLQRPLLELWAKSMPDDAYAQFALGEAYLSTGAPKSAARYHVQ